MTAPPHRLHLMVVDGAIRFATQAEKALDEQDFETAHFALNNSRNFVSELISGLAADRSPELVDQLKGLFFFVYRNLVEADLDRDAQKVRDALSVLRLHRNTWVELIEKLKQEQAGAVNPPHLPTDSPAKRSWTG